MQHPFWNDEALTRQKVDRALFEIDDETSAQNEEEFIVIVMALRRLCDPRPAAAMAMDLDRVRQQT